MATSSSEGDDLRDRSQQPALASQQVKESETQRRRGFGNMFPLGAKEGFNQWWTSLSPAMTEHRVLSFIPLLQKPPTHTETGSAPVSASNSTTNVSSQDGEQLEQVTTNSINDPHGPRRWSSQMVHLSGKNRALNEFSIERIGEPVEQNLVMLHGYGAGLGFFYKNFEGLSRAEGWKLYALDMLGMGRSTRPKFEVHAKERADQVTEAENWFIDALEEWRVKKKLERFTLLGHSLGGYLAVAYALKYPGHLNKLILASPVGIPEDPYAVNAAMPEPEDSTMANEFLQDQNEAINNSNPNATKPGDNNNFLNARSKAAKSSSGTSTPSSSEPPRKPLPGWLVYLWDKNISPFSLVRWSGPLGPRLVSGWTSRRFSHLPDDEAQALHDYSYSLFRQPGSGEYALGRILAPGAFARSPLIRRIQGVGRQYIGPHSGPIVDADAPKDTKCHKTSKKQVESAAPSITASDPDGPRVRETGIPIVLMYGEHDWMDIAGGYAAEEKIKQERARLLADASEEEKRNDHGSAKVVIIHKAGHHVYLDGPEQFNQVMLEEMRDVMRKERIRTLKDGISAAES
ncbi:alpha/beta hydrolase [Mytilinidion resinicola]|uniref:Alpha/beta hydrolase n=1 Tax=Mytilinidion resinicola TaxID=574789 RepID=A0A6A6ZB28_9PEZI|nr:alpha/beta hydrolase [Mytilinidion resinicola]KAF2817514.1 alpha/beta hydrolase [Mytilinidion resinicola]